MMIKKIYSALLAVSFLLPLVAQKKDEYQLNKFKSHDDDVWDVQFSPDGKQFVSASRDKTAILWDIESGKEIKVMEGHIADVRKVVYKADGNQIITAGDKSLKLWNSAGIFIKSIGGHNTYILDMDISNDGKFLVTCSYDDDFKLWDVMAEEEIAEFEGHDKTVSAVCFSPNGKYIASGSQDETIRLWSRDTRENLLTLQGHHDVVYSIAFSNSGEYLVSSGRDNTIKLWDISSGDCIKTYISHDKAVMNTCFTPDDNHLVSASIDGTIVIQEVKTGKRVYSFIDHEEGVNAIDFSPDGKYMLSASIDDLVILWDFSRKIFVEYHNWKAFQEEMNQSSLFEDKRKDESRDDYEERQAKAHDYREKLLEKYYQEYAGYLRGLSFR